jgi:hypothetical protein
MPLLLYKEKKLVWGISGVTRRKKMKKKKKRKYV